MIILVLDDLIYLLSLCMCVYAETEKEISIHVENIIHDDDGGGGGGSTEIVLLLVEME